MTIAIGIRYCGGALLYADSEITYGGIAKSHEWKISYEESDESILAMAFAGSVPFARMFIEECNEGFHELADKSKKSIRKHVSTKLSDFHGSHIYVHPQKGYLGGPDFSLIVGIWSKIDGLDFFSTSESAINKIDEFHCIGVGEYLARYVIQQDFVPMLSCELAEKIANKAIKAAKANIPGCGGAHSIVFLGEGRGKSFVSG